jgi:hypothetical protein
LHKGEPQNQDYFGPVSLRTKKGRKRYSSGGAKNECYIKDEGRFRLKNLEIAYGYEWSKENVIQEGEPKTNVKYRMNDDFGFINLEIEYVRVRMVQSIIQVGEPKTNVK